MRWRRALRFVAWVVLAPIPVAVALVALLWWWAGTGDSLGVSIARAAAYLPAGQTLETDDVKGSLRNGGHIGMLRWRGGGLMVEGRDIELGWEPMALVNHKLTLQTLFITHLVIDDQRPASPLKAPQSFVLPISVDVSFAVQDLQWKGAAPLTATDVAGRYGFDGTTHTLTMDNADMASAHYEGRATLLARAPMTLNARLRGDIQAPVPGGAAKPLPLQFDATARGPLAGDSAALDVQAGIRPGSVTATVSPIATAGSAMRASVTARIMPWAPQPVAQGSATFSNLNLAALWPQAPQTLLQGNASVQPVAGAAQQWQAQADLGNSASGPWDKQRLPVQSAKVRVRYAGGGWDIESLDADVGGGHLQAQGRLQLPATAVATTATAASTSGTAAAASRVTRWQGTAQWRGVNPAALHTQLAAASLDGELQAHAAGQAIDFDANLKPSARQPAASKLQGLRIKQGMAKGRWAAGRLTLQTLRLESTDALLVGQQIDVLMASRAGSGQLQLTLPGAQASISGRISAADGAGEFKLHASDAGQASRWLAQLPGMPAALQTANAKGEADAAGQWKGGWQNEGRNLNLQAAVTAPQLDIHRPGLPPEQAWRVREFKAELNGQLSALALQLAGRLETGTQRYRLQTSASGGRTASGGWQGRVDSAALQVHDSFRPGTWTVRLQAPVNLGWQSGAALVLSPGEASLSGPVPGTATIAWQNLSWRQAAGRSELITRGQLRGLPMGWLEVLGNTQLGNLGLAGTMVFDGEWDVQAADTFRAQASLQRRSGDLRVQADTDLAGAATGVQINAGVKEASLKLTSDGSQLKAVLRWDSENAGQASADITTALSRDAQGWTWPDNAALSGTVRAHLPRVGVWSVLAPPGWRIRGTLDANATLAGTRKAPLWRGTLRADDLAVRSVVEGIEFSGGKLRATLNGQRLGIDEFSLRGAPGGGAAARAGTAPAQDSSGGLLTITGFAEWLPDAPATSSILNKVRMELSAKADSLRVTARADRRLIVSGALNARLVDKRIELRGNLKADQALFILPDESTPVLGSDVVVHSSSSRPATASSALPETAGVRILPDVAITLGLGNDFRVQGRGVSTRLAGTLALHTTLGATAAPRLTGEVQAVAGTYRAYGQYLNIEEGVLRFTGPFDNPSLDILAVRPNLSVRVGVQITGTALAPRVRLYSNPEMAESEKLAGLVLGRSAAAGGAESAVLQQAALALLGGRNGGMSGGIAQSIGLDELSFRGSATAADGTTSAAAVTLGKRLSRDFYVAYERSLAGTLGTFYIFYDLSKRFTLRAQTGEQSAVDLIFTLPYD
ncbi:MAG: translocation/assembly module TamB domain-containing protein [Burkholderiaceae bacterium]|nr:translocation/assembly module TamB domain-containing protein [Burkholderiaceae bacterium]